MNIIDRIFRHEEKPKRRPIGTYCSVCGEDIQNGTGCVKMFGIFPSWGSIRCKSCFDKEQKENKNGKI